MSGPFQAHEAERAVIGALLLDSSALTSVQDVLRDEDFTDARNRRVFASIAGLVAGGAFVDEVTVATALRSAHGANDADFEFLSDLVGKTPSAANIRTYASQVAIASRLRKLSEIALDTAQACIETPVTTEQEAQNFFADIQTRMVNATTFGTPVHLTTREVVVGVLKFAEERKENRGKMLGPTSGFNAIDNLLYGVRRKRLHIVAAKTGAGKTALALNMARSMARDGSPGFVVSLEMGTDELGLRLVSQEARVSGLKVESGTADSADLARLARGVGDLISLPITWTDNPPHTMAALRAECQAVKRKTGLDWVIVDYLQLMSGSGKTHNREGEVSEISRGLKRLAGELDIAVIALSQLNRKKERHEPPALSDLRDSGAIEQDANVVLFLWADDDETEDINWKIAKNRGGALGQGVMRFRKNIQRFEETPS